MYQNMLLSSHSDELPKRKMEHKKKIQRFWKTFLHPHVLFFILIGTGVIFLTFLTDDNAIEIVISGIASVFIGIGVNNFSMLETHVKDEKKLKLKIAHALKVMEITSSRIQIIYHKLDKESCPKMKVELEELEQIMSLGISLVKEDNLLD
ncbi:MAG: hypothetical protein ABIO76_09315 [Ginsengibacter sp.]